MNFQNERRRDDARTIEDNWVEIPESKIKNNIDVTYETLEEKALKASEITDFVEFSTFSQHRILPFINNEGKFCVFYSSIKRLPKSILDKCSELVVCDQALINSYMTKHWNTGKIDVVKFLNSEGVNAVGIAKMFLQKMIDVRAADLTIHSLIGHVEISYAVGGKNVTSLKDIIPPELAEKIRVSLINMAAENQAEKIVDGSFATRLSGQIKEFRLSYIETELGYSMVLRSYESFDLNKKVEDLGYMGKPLSIIKNILDENTYGIFLITGPTGSGKTTTIYTVINQQNVEKDLKIKTAEDPVEVVISGIDQCSINKKGDEKHLITYQRLLEVYMRQKPDIIVVGEIRNKEVASSAVEAALTGHIVISTLHTNNVKSTFTRLTSNLDVSTDRIEDAFSGVLSQRLVPKICKHCATKTDDGYIAGNGCDNCAGKSNEIGYDGVVLACEVAHMHKNINNYIPENFKEYYSYSDSAEDLKNEGLIDIKTYKMLKAL